MRPVLLVLGRAAVVEHIAVASLGFWVRLGCAFALVAFCFAGFWDGLGCAFAFSPGSIGRLCPIIMGDFICYYWEIVYLCDYTNDNEMITQEQILYVSWQYI
jgi:hypothetical protein